MVGVYMSLPIISQLHDVTVVLFMW